MAYPDKKRTVAKIFKNALDGIFQTMQTERNFRIQTFIAVIVIIAGLYFQISLVEWLVLIVTVFIVLALELMNTAVEKAVDLVTNQYHPLAKLAKDAAAASVLLFSIGAAIIGVIIFLPRIVNLFL